MQENGSRLLTKNEVSSIRSKVQEILVSLEKELKVGVHKAPEEVESNYHNSWLNGPVSVVGVSNSCRYLDSFGFLHIPSFASSDEVESMKQQMLNLIQDWDPSSEGTVTFSTKECDNEAQGSDDYFLESASRVHFFAEPDAVDPDASRLKDEFKDTITTPQYKVMALNKSGHALHTIPGPFHDYTISDKVKSLVHELGWKDPIVPQSMYICKNSKIGGTVHSHQDSTFLYTEPRQSCLGLWLALDPATLHNGCLWVRPKSHHEPVRRQFRRNVAHFSQSIIDERSNYGIGDTTQPKMIFQVHPTHNDAPSIPWEGSLPDGAEPPCEGLLQAGFIPIECQAGDLLAFVGQLDHLSLPNYSDDQRHTFQLHLVEGPEAGVEWSKYNWLQYPKGKDFVSLKLDSN
jgi:phytanoyl-CoA hydroxylase